MKQLNQLIAKKSTFFQILFASLVCFAAYTCMYMFRRSYTASAYSNTPFLGIAFKSWMIISQVLGYMCAKIYGIKFISENKRLNRSRSIIILITIAWLAWLLFALVPRPFNLLFLFLNGFPLGLIWGLVFSFVEGRRYTEMIGAALCSSFIFASGFAKSIGTWLLNSGITETWMPFFSGAIFILPLILFAYFLEAIPEPNEDDKLLRTARIPINKAARKLIIKKYLPGLAMAILAYVALTILRDFRDGFLPEIIKAAHIERPPAFYTKIETIIAVILLISMAILVLIKNNFKAFVISHIFIAAGFAIALLATVLYQNKLISETPWLLCTGLGFYMGYVPFNCLFFERMIASFKIAANAGFFIYLADSFCYLGSITITAIKGFTKLQLDWVSFFTSLIYIGCSIGLILITGSLIWFKNKIKNI